MKMGRDKDCNGLIIFGEGTSIGKVSVISNYDYRFMCTMYHILAQHIILTLFVFILLP